MPDSHASPTAPALVPPPPVSQPSPSPATRTAPAAALLQAAHVLLPSLEAGRALDAATLRGAMTEAFDGTDAEGAWSW